MPVSAETQRSRYETMKAVIFGAPRTELVRDLFLIQHIHYPDDRVAVLATMAWAPPIVPMTIHPDGIELPGRLAGRSLRQADPRPLWPRLAGLRRVPRGDVRRPLG